MLKNRLDAFRNLDRSESEKDVPVSEELAELARIVRQRLEFLKRSGVDWLPKSDLVVQAIRRPPTVAHIAAPLPPPDEPAPRPAPRPIPAPVATAVQPPASLFAEPMLEGGPVPISERSAQLELLRAEVAACVRCPLLAETRTQTVFGEGNPAPRLMFIGEAPGADEDRTGRPFVGKAGQLLTDMITKGMGLAREDVYITNVLKSRPPENRDPEPEEIAHCLPFLERQLAIVRPEFICLLGRIAAQSLLDTSLPVGRLRGKWHRVRGIPALVTYHPSYLLRNPPAKKDAWNDLQILMKAMGISQPGRK